MAVTGQQRIVFTGVAATLRLGYQKAATLGAWRIEGNYLTAKVDDYDGFRITQAPLVLEITYTDSAPTRRPLEDVTVHQGQLSARLVPKRSEF
jgi:hypothetical protein